MSAPRISKLTFGHYASPLGIGTATPTLSWRFEQDAHTAPNWAQAAYELSLRGEVFRVDSSESVHVPWPGAPLRSRERVAVRVRALGPTGWTEWFEEPVEAALLAPSDWVAAVAAPDTPPPPHAPKRPFYLRHTFTATAGDARLYASALGVYTIRLNGAPVGDHVLAPGWQSYGHRLHYQTYPVTLRDGENVLEATVGEGWYAGRLSWVPHARNMYGAEPGLLAQLEWGGEVLAASGEGWEWAYGPLLGSELYDGESCDLGLEVGGWRAVKSLPRPAGLVAPEAPPVRRTQSLAPVELITTPSGRRILDFGQNLVGWVQVHSVPARVRPSDTLTLRYAEVLERGELGTRPLRGARATDTIYPGPRARPWEPSFTLHGFRYCEVSGPEGILDDYAANFTAVVVHSDMERLGDFTCSHALVNKFHENVVWSLRGNFVSVPTDCPQRDERCVDP
jgi:alpha-L-rhamnosidase